MYSTYRSLYLCTSYLFIYLSTSIVCTILLYAPVHAAGVVGFQVVFRDGIFVRSSPSIEEGRVIRIAPFGTLLTATGRVSAVGTASVFSVAGGVVLLVASLVVIYLLLHSVW